jgi:hypothetical protein
MQLLVGPVEDAHLPLGRKLRLGMKEDSMFILMIFILAYRHHRAGANGIGQAPVRKLATSARSTSDRRRGQMANRERSDIRSV